MSDSFYVYTLAYPDGTVFYVGKGTKNRLNAHEREARNGKQSYKCHVIRKIWANGGEVVKTKVRENLTEADAYAYEIELISSYERRHLTNMTNGGEGGEGGARPGAGRPMKDISANQRDENNMTPMMRLWREEARLFGKDVSDEMRAQFNEWSQEYQKAQIAKQRARRQQS